MSAPGLALPADTDIAADRVQVAIWRRLGPEGRLAVMLALNEEMDAIARAGIRGRHPEYTDEEVRLARIRQRLGDELFRRVYPGVEVMP